MKAPDISVVICFFGDYCNFAQQCLSSLVAQEFKDFEVVLILDGPTRFRSQLYNDLKSSGLNFTFIENPKNLSLLQSRSRAASRANGTYLAFLDHDDTYPPNFLAELHQTAQVMHADVVECPIFEYEIDGTLSRSRRFRTDKLRTDEEILLCYLIGRSANNLVTKLVRKAVWDRSCGELMADLKNAYVNYAEDILFTVSVYKHARVYATTSDTHYNYIKRPSSSVNPHSLDVVRNSASQLQVVLDYVERNSQYLLAPDAIAAFFRREAAWGLDHLDRRLTHIASRTRLSPHSVHQCRQRIAAMRKRYLEKYLRPSPAKT